ncbi:MAG: GxxExxY protein [Phycisphaerae bacterium]|nr:GxxExxY protein [Gemmatimonadaceae bacterium]
MPEGMRDKRRELHYELTERIIRGFYDVLRELGPGLPEVVYQRAMPIALADLGLSCAVEVPYHVTFRGHVVGSYRADLVVEGRVIVETKSILQIKLTHEEQILNYMRIAAIPVGLILNFGPRPTVQRYALPTK